MSSGVILQPEPCCMDRYKTTCWSSGHHCRVWEQHLPFKNWGHEAVKVLQGFKTSRSAESGWRAGVCCNVPMENKMKSIMGNRNHFFNCTGFFRSLVLPWEEHSGHNPLNYFSLCSIWKNTKILVEWGSAFLTSGLLLSRLLTHTYLARAPIFSFYPTNSPPWNATPLGYKSTWSP